jgi:hypothetical protein
MFTKEDKQALSIIHSLSAQPRETVNSVLQSLLVSIFLDYTNGIPTRIPGLGVLKISYKGDKVVRRGIRADVDVQLELSDFVLRNLGQLKDGTETDLEKLLKEEIKNEFSAID